MEHVFIHISTPFCSILQTQCIQQYICTYIHTHSFISRHIFICVCKYLCSFVDFSHESFAGAIFKLAFTHPRKSLRGKAIIQNGLWWGIKFLTRIQQCTISGFVHCPLPRTVVRRLSVARGRHRMQHLTLQVALLIWTKQQHASGQ